MKHIKTFEAFSDEDIMEEGWKDIASAVTKPFRKRTDQEIEADAASLINDKSKLAKIEDILKRSKNPTHYEKYQKTKQEFDKGNKMPFYKFILLVKDNIGDFENNNPVYYSTDSDNTGQYDFGNRGPGGRTY